MKHVT